MNGGHHTHELNPFFAQAVQEHQRLHHAIELIHTQLATHPKDQVTAADVTRITTMIALLRDGLQSHFAHEEEGGYLEEALTHVPQLAPQAAILQRQHAEFLQLAEQMLSDARRDEPVATVWSRLEADYRTFAKRLQAHEAAENSLLQKAFNEDLGLET